MNSFLNGFKDKVKNKKIKIAVVGLGYVGLPLAIEFNKKGFFVLGVDVDQERVSRIRKKKSYITDISDKELSRAVASRKFTAEHSFSCLRQADVVFICVPTPLKKKYYPDISFIKSAVRGISGHIRKQALIILESTTYPGTTEEVILPMLESKGLKHGKDFYLCFSPERIDPGNVQYTVDKIPKVIGGISKEALYLGKTIYESLVSQVVLVSSTRVAETVKLLENTFRIVNIGLIDEMAMMCHKMNINIWEVIAAAKTKPFGFMPFYPGAGVGGHCIPKDPLYLFWKAKQHGFKSRFIKLSSQIITYMPQYVLERVEAILNKQGLNLNKARILLVGVTYKKDVKDLRKSPALDMIDILHKKGIRVSYYDPLIPYLKLNHTNLKSVEFNCKRLKQFDCVIIAANHSAVDYSFLRKNSRLIFDTRNVYNNITDSKIYKL